MACAVALKVCYSSGLQTSRIFRAVLQPSRQEKKVSPLKRRATTKAVAPGAAKHRTLSPVLLQEQLHGTHVMSFLFRLPPGRDTSG